MQTFEPRSVKTTVNIPAKYRDNLRYFVEQKRIPSFSEGINQAIENYIAELRRAEYAEQMAAAAHDKGFIARTMECQAEMTEEGAPGQW